MDVKLTIYSDDKQYFSQSISLPCVIGRARQCGVAIVHPLVSRQHCELYEQDGKPYVRDLGSLNGTMFNGVRIGRGVQLPYGSEFSIGRLFFRVDSAFAFCDEPGEPSASPAPKAEPGGVSLEKKPVESRSANKPDDDELDSEIFDELNSELKADESSFADLAGLEFDDLSPES